MENAVIEIKVLGAGCDGCLEMGQTVIEALRELGIWNARLEIISEERVAEYGLYDGCTPGLLIDGCLVWAGSPPGKDQLMEWITMAATPTII
jgi:hypothetical protein